MAKLQPVIVRNVSRGAPLFSGGFLATAWRDRLVGLMGRRSLGPDEGLVIRPCESIHTLWMRFPIDVVFLDAGGTVVAVFPRVRPFRLRFGGGWAHAVVEGPLGMIERSGTRTGDRIVLENRAAPCNPSTS
jgi:uncharacterized membrane protein (UPF0127 family)